MLKSIRAALAAMLAIATIVLAGAAPAAAELDVTALQVTPRLDIRATAGDHDGLDIQQAEVDVVASISDGENELVTLNLQHVLETPMTGRAKDMHFGNLYGVFNLGPGKPALKAGQFVVPFGTLAEFDTHGTPLQTPYARTLGIRIDQGVGLDGAAGDLDWSAALTTGNGRGRYDGSWALSARAARDFESGQDIVRVGASALVGESMPVFPTNAMSMPMGMDDQVEYRDKWRVALDLDWLRGIDNVRGEFVAGQDDGEFVNGQWLYYEHPFSYDSSLALQGDRWSQPDGTSYGVGVQYHHRLDDWSGVRLAAEKRWADTRGMSEMSMSDSDSEMFTIQYYREWAWAPNF
ncbi:MAG TPA: hypothetical protein DEP45_06245 [Armatimonadetes bacterium]|nr:hypothetical protein [Armatimonadota bacterium]